MSKTKIEWCDYTINPVKGLCPMACSYCYARRMYKRFKWNPRIEWDEQCLLDLRKIKKPSRIFVGSTMELFGDWIHPNAMGQILGYCKPYTQHTFIFLTRQPQNLQKWSPFPDNCWVGISATDFQMYGQGIFYLGPVEAKVKFISFEPLLERIHPHEPFGPYTSEMMAHDFTEFTGINWLILGSQTQPIKHPPKEWVDEIISAADKAKIPVFVKEPMASHYGIRRQEFPGDSR